MAHECPHDVVSCRAVTAVDLGRRDSRHSQANHPVDRGAPAQLQGALDPDARQRTRRARAALVNIHSVSRSALLSALGASGKGIEDVLVLGIAAGGMVPPSRGYVWRNLPLDVGHVLAYFVAHEAHHRGQLVMVARQLGHRLPPAVTNGLWQWTTFVREEERRRKGKAV